MENQMHLYNSLPVGYSWNTKIQSDLLLHHAIGLWYLITIVGYSMYWLDYGLGIRDKCFDSWQEQKIYLSQSVQIGYEAHNPEGYNLKNPLYKDNFTVIVTRPKE